VPLTRFLSAGTGAIASILMVGGLTLGAAQAPPTPAAPAAAQGRAAATPVNPDPRTMPLWDGAAPGAQGTADADIPTLTYYPVYGRPSTTAVIVAPGGGYSNLAMNHEGRQVANWYNSQGVAAFVLKYRLGPKYHHPIELGDAQRAIRIVRARAAEFGVRPDRIGIMGFSAGGHLASTAATHFDAGNAAATDPIERVSSRPDFLVLGYPVVMSAAPYAHQGSFRSLLGESPDPALLENLSNERQVTKDTPPTFLFHTNADTTVPAENSVQFYLALRKAGVPAELHIFEPGAHGVGLAMNDPVLDAWPPLLSTWLRTRGLLTPPAATTPATGRGQ
jgi:acetyl esterase/lipase